MTNVGEELRADNEKQDSRQDAATTHADDAQTTFVANLFTGIPSSHVCDRYSTASIGTISLVR